MVQGEERKYGHLGEDPDLNFLTPSHEPSESGTTCLAPRTRNAGAKLKIQLRQLNDKMIVKTSVSAYKTRTANRIECLQTQNVIRPDKLRTLIGHKMHGATSMTLKGTDVSHSNLTDVSTHKSDT
jgi:hypothetical protein